MKKKIYSLGYAYFKMMYNKLAKKLNTMFINGTFENLTKSKQVRLLNKLATTGKQIGGFDIKPSLRIALLGLGISFTGNVFAQNPTFVKKTGSDNPFNGLNFGQLASPSMVDLDGDGDLDLCLAESTGKVHFIQNIGTSKNPSFSTADSIIFTQENAITFQTFVDIDNDEDQDAFIFSGQNENTYSLKYYQNIGTKNVASFNTTPIDTIVKKDFTYPAFVDIDNDGDQDLFVGSYYGTISYYKNNGTASNPDLIENTESNPLDFVNAGIFSAPAFADIDNDGDKDLIVGNYNGDLKYYKNTGDKTNASFELQTGVNNPFDNFSFNLMSIFALADIDDDGDSDIVIGDYNGDISYLENTTVLTSLENNVNSNLFSLYPNPATDKLNIRLQEPSSGSVSILDMNGNVLKSQQLNGLESTISTSNLVNGTYLVKISVENNSSTKLLTILK